MNSLYQSFFRKILFRLEPEQAHDLTCGILGYAETIPIIKKIISQFLRVESKNISLFGLNFSNCVGLAAGLDKNGMFPGISSSLGFGHIEVGTVTPLPQPGNPKPRLFRYPEEKALVNRMGFNNVGAKAVVERLARYNPIGSRVSPIGINIGKGKNTLPEKAINDYLIGFETVVEQADYITINISSPNTPGLRLLHQKSFLEPLLRSLHELNHEIAKGRKSNPVPCLLKISPDESYKDLESIIELALENKFDGIIATNTTTRRNVNFPSLEKGGLSGKPLEHRSLSMIKFIVEESSNKLPVIGVGGIHDSDSAHKKLDAGASLLQLYTSFIYNGPLFPARLVNSLHTRSVWP